MNNAAKVLLVLTIFCSGLFGGYIYGSKGMVKIEQTRSGMFVIRNAKIYEVLELPTNNTSFQDSYSEDSKFNRGK